MMKILSSAALSLLAGAVGAWLVTAQAGSGSGSEPTSVQQKESAFDRVMRTGTLRCGYASAPPLLMKDPNTGVLSGIGHDVLEEIAKGLSLKIEWAEEVGWATFPVALKTHRIDAFCVGAWPSSPRAREVDHTNPIAYQPYYAYSRVDDRQYDGNIKAVNSPNVTLSIMDGDASQIIARTDFPQAKFISIIESANPDEMLHNVTARKADVAFIDPMFFAAFDENNPGKIRRVESAPLRVFGNVFFIAQGEDKLRQMLDTAIGEQLSSGAVDKIIAKYEKVPGSILRVAPPYRLYSKSE